MKIPGGRFVSLNSVSPESLPGVSRIVIPRLDPRDLDAPLLVGDSVVPARRVARALVSGAPKVIVVRHIANEWGFTPFGTDLPTLTNDGLIVWGEWCARVKVVDRVLDELMPWTIFLDYMVPRIVEKLTAATIVGAIHAMPRLFEAYIGYVERFGSTSGRFRFPGNPFARNTVRGLVEAPAGYVLAAPMGHLVSDVLHIKHAVPVCSPRQLAYASQLFPVLIYNPAMCREG